MNKPICLVGGFFNAEEWISKKIMEEEVRILNGEISIEDIKNFRKFLTDSSLNQKIGIIYFFNTLSESKQSVLLKIFEDLPDFSKVIIHASHFVNFTIHTRCDVTFLKKETSLQKDLDWLLNFFKISLKKASLSEQKKRGISVYLETMNLFLNGFLSEDEKKIILNDLRGI